MAPKIFREEEKQESQSNHGALQSENFKFEENEVMTSYEGFWVRKNKKPWLTAMYYKFHRKIAARKDIVTDEQKQAKLDRCMKKILRNEHRMLKIALAKDKKYYIGSELHINKDKSVPKGTGDQSSEVAQPWQGTTTESEIRSDSIRESVSELDMPLKLKRKRCGKYLNISYNDNPDIVKYEGFYVNASSANRLDNLKKKLTKKGMSADNIRKEFRKVCRQEERLCKKEKKKQNKLVNKKKILIFPGSQSKIIKFD